jgi:putative acetyltransferase
LGEPAYYARFGFSAAAALPFPCPYAGPYFMALSLTGGKAAPAPVIYAPAFDRLSGADQAS